MSNHTPAVSIGMPVYNGEMFLREAIDSLLAQTFSDFELIISDNASSDATQTICLQYQKFDNRIHYLRQAENIGALANFQVVLNESRGDCFMWAACDDKWDARWIELLYEKLMVSNSISAFGRVKQIDELSRVIRNHPANVNLFSFSESFFKRRVSFFLEFEGDGKANLFYSLYRREMFQQVDLSRYSQDYYALFDWLRMTRFVSVENIFLYKRIHSSNAGGMQAKSFLVKMQEIVTFKTIYTNYAIAAGYIAYMSRLEKLMLLVLVPIKIFNSHLFYIKRIFKG